MIYSLALNNVTRLNQGIDRPNKAKSKVNNKNNNSRSDIADSDGDDDDEKAERNSIFIDLLINMAKSLKSG